MTQEEIRSFVKRYKVAIYKQDPTKLQALFAENDDKARQQLKDNKPAILAYLKEQEAIEAAREARKASIEETTGYLMIKKSISEYNAYRAKFERAMESESGVFPSAPKVANPDEMRKQYPVGAAYATIKSNTYSENSSKCAIYKRALENIYDGADIVTTYEAAEKEWSKEAERLTWND